MGITNKSYFNNYLKTYLWNGLGVLLNLASMFIVVPMITDNKIVYGIYTVCISTAIFLSYADLGFVSAGIKYAAENYAKGDSKSEMELYGFSGFVLFVFVCIISAVFLVFSFNPLLLIKDINDPVAYSIASKLLFIQAIFSYKVVLERFVSGVFQVRIEQYHYQKIIIVGSTIRILSVFYFFSPGKYDIVGYFLFANIVGLLANFVGLWIIEAKYKLSILAYIKAFRYNKSVFNKTKHLALSSLFITLMWILYYELDIVVIGRLLGASAVAVYALAFTFIKFFGSLSSIIFTPFDSRYNHLVGLNDIKGMGKLLQKVIMLSLPVFIFAVLSVIILSKKIILCWAGNEYIDSWIILSILSINFLFSAIVIPGASVLKVMVKIKEMYWINIIMVVVFWSGVMFTLNNYGIISFALFKVISGFLAMIFYLYVLLKILNISFLEFLKLTAIKMVIPIGVQVIFLFLIISFLPVLKGKLNLMIIIGVGSIAALFGFFSLYLSSRYYRKEFDHYLSKILKIK
jgi:O-antigen/teichoic acid export membrane protein